MQEQKLTPVNFSEHLSLLIKMRGMTQKRLAAELGVSEASIVKWIKGSVPLSTTLNRIADYFGLHPDYLLNPKKYSDSLSEAVALAGQAKTEEKQNVFNDAARRSTERLGRGMTAGNGARGALKAARMAKGLTIKDVAKKVGYSVSVYQDIEDGLSRMGRKQADKLAKILEVDVDELLAGSDHPPEKGGMFGSFGEVPDVAVPDGMRVKYVPLISMAECGQNVAWDDGGYTGEGFAVFDCKDPKAYAVTLSGESMMPDYKPGDVAIVYPSFRPRNGDVVIAKLDDSHGADVMFKLYHQSGELISLTSYNPAYPKMTFECSAFEWIRPVVQVTKTLRRL